VRPRALRLAAGGVGWLTTPASSSFVSASFNVTLRAPRVTGAGRRRPGLWMRRAPPGASMTRPSVTNSVTDDLLMAGLLSVGRALRPSSRAQLIRLVESAG
jgi:hypothetical protein